MFSPFLKKIFFPFLSAALCFAAVFFRKKLLATCIGYLAVLFASYFGKQLAFESITYEQGKFSLANISLATRSSQFFKAESVDIKISRALSSLKFQGQCVINNPELTLDPNRQGKKFTFQESEKWLKSLRFCKNIRVNSGVLNVHDANSVEKYPFSFEIASRQDLLYLDLQIPSLPAIFFSKHLEAYETFLPYTLTSGSLKGDIKLCCSNVGHILMLQSSIIGEQVVVEKYQEKLRVCLGEVVFSTSYKNTDGQPLYLQDLGAQSSLEGIHPSLLIKNSSLFISDLQGKLLWTAKDIDFFACFSQQGIPEVTASGHIIKGAMELPFSFQGKGIFQGFDSWDLDLLNSAEIPSELKRCKRIGVKKQGPQQFLIALDVDDIDELDMHMMQELLDPIFKDVTSFKFHKGKLKADLNFCIKQGIVEYIECKDLVIKEGFVEDKQRGIIAHIPCLKASARIESPFSSQPKLPHWELHFNSARLKHPLFVDQLSCEGQIFCQGELHLSAVLKVRCSGVSIVCESNGSFNRQDIKMQIVPGDNNYFTSLQQRALSRAPSIESLEKVFLDFSLVNNHKTLCLEGAACIEFDQGCQDEIQFKLDTSLQEFIQKPLIASKVIFSSKKVSSNTYLLILESFGLKWFVLADMAVTGTLDHQGLHFETYAEQAFYDSEDIMVTLPKKEELYYGKFHFDWEARRWDIFLPLKQARCEDKKLHLPFTSVNTDIYIQGTDLFAKNLTALCEKVFFSGQIHIDFKDPSWVDLKLYPHQMEGEVEDFLKFLSHIVDPQFFSNLPSIKGRVKGAADNFFCLKYNLTQIYKKAKVQLLMEELEATFFDTCNFSKGSCVLSWDIQGNFLEIKDFSSKLVVLEQEGESIYQIKVPEFSCKNLERASWDFDFRLATSTIDLARLTGKMFSSKDIFVIQMQDTHNHLFGNPLQIFEMGITSDYSLDYINLKAQVFDHGFFAGLDFFKKTNLLASKLSVADMISTSATWKQASIELTKHSLDPMGKFQLLAEGFSIFQNAPHLLNLQAVFNIDKQFKLDFSYGDLQAFCHLEKDTNIWSLALLEAKYKNGLIRSYQGTMSSSLIHVNFSSFTWDLEGLAHYVEKLPNQELFAQRIIHGGLEIKVTLPSQEQSTKVEGSFSLHSLSKLSTELTLQTTTPLLFCWSQKTGLEINQLDLQIFLPNTSQNYSSIQFEKAAFKGVKDFYIRGAKLSINPETFQYFVKQYPALFNFSSRQIQKLFSAEFIWDNHIETQLDFLADGQAFQIQGVLKEGYYWIGKESIYLQKVYYFLDQGHCNVVFGLDYKDITLDVLAKLQFKEDVELQLSLKPFHEESCSDERKSLEIVCKYEKTEGFYVQSVEGELFGIQASFRKNPRAYGSNILLLTGHLKCNPAKLACLFKQTNLAVLKDLGSGYELSGDIFICKQDLLASHFRGYFKGRDFHLYDFYFKTLLSEVDVKFNQLQIHDLSLSDLSGVLKVKQIKIQKEDGSWKMKIPEVVLQDFRPSFLRKSLNQEEKIKPLVIKNLHIFNIEGTLGNLESFKGRGYLDFINTFKREMHILDIPIEIIGRIGFDLGIFIPVIGKLEFEVVKGKVVLKELKNTFSEGRRSRFYLSGYKDSFIGLDGELAIDIKMKQYVLLKFTEPFTLSIRGTVTKPRYSLR